MDEQKQKLIERINQAQNILVTVSTNPSVDQLSAAIGLTLVLNQMDKHGTAVFSGAVPSTIEFLKPEDTLEKNTDSLRDFIIALDKSKADKLRYKVEDQVVRIFITPYKTSLSEKDLQFSQGDFNVDVVVCLGVNEQQDLDTAITAHGRILHDATVVSVSTTGQGSLGSINWVDPKASSLCEMMVSLTEGLDKKALNNQVSTAFLTGIVASTERFRNEKTTPRTMSASATLMSAGANQQLRMTRPARPPKTPSQ
jgi:nanoRNase/pAp phosphatase (c-di-AMP/oligoRNAs hydrolase)